ncbi:hypothetical protein [Alteraurantiacibacter aquimixticola]|uniref:Uncharacterized protein n=1 Tax=Alteraurantiacibacter aquimixticola TaxID=2489173 RepID=A0A4T3F4W9_9SPHN|nr:hypothetical protein [Alteraurantiacibacter aquimixticola]TIX50558.1 hypothetical protein E5222_09840 [Alteraurantiacibacter aquimixticola]
MDTPPAPIFTPAPTSPATLAQLDELVGNSRAAHARFQEAAGNARAPVRAAAGSPVGSDSWARAQVQVAALESVRSEALMALAEIDSLYAEAAVSGGEVAQLEQARSDVSAMVADEDRLIAELLGQIGS